MVDTIELESTSESEDSDEEIAARIEGRELLTPELAAALDRSKVSDRRAARILLTSVQALSTDKIVLSRSNLQRLRVDARAKIYTAVKSNFSATMPLTVHWDGKILPDYNNTDKFDRLPVLVSNLDMEKLQYTPMLPHGTGRAQAEAVRDALLDWNLAGRVVAMCSDTPTTNTGETNGAAVLIEELLDKPLVF